LLDEACRSYFLDMPGAGGMISGAGANVHD
jgi:hypothetical protein